MTTMVDVIAPIPISALLPSGVKPATGPIVPTPDAHEITTERQAPRTSLSGSRTPSRPPSRTERRFECTFDGCSKAYFKPSRLAEHMRTHTGERPHICDECGQKYLRASHLAAHQRTHKSEDDKPFACTREGCDKKFWTATHLRRHEEAHESAEVHQCETCGATFAKTHLLREHVADAHMPQGSKPWACTHCSASFATKQKLRAHERTHDPTRYTCSHPSHGTDMPMFPVWSVLQAHIRDTHPPTCPHPECAGRTFKSPARLREHLRVHSERDADVEAGRHDEDDDDALPPVIAEAGSRRKRKRRQSDAASVATAAGAADTPGTGASTPRKLPRLLSGEAGKDWICGAPGCGARFKSRFARDEHAQAAHSTGRHKCDVCGRAYRRPASLKRHKAAGWCGSEGVNAPPSGAGTPPTPVVAEDLGALLTGTATLPGGSHHRRWACPHRADDGSACVERFHRVYDVRRHLAAAHDIALDDMATREMLLADGQTGDEAPSSV